MGQKEKYDREKDIFSDVFRSLRDGDHSAYEEVYLKYVSSIKKFLTVLTRSEEIAEEITQETFVTLWEKRESIDPDKNISGYLFTIAKHFALKYFKRNQVLLGEEFMMHEKNRLDLAPDEILIGKEQEILTDIAVKRMPAQRRKIYEFSRKDGLTNGEIAERLQISKNTVENHITSALKDIRKIIILFLLLNILSNTSFLHDKSLNIRAIRMAYRLYQQTPLTRPEL